MTSSDLPTTTQGGGNYGAIGIGRPATTNPVRRSSVPTNQQPKQPHRKTSYGEYTFVGQVECHIAEIFAGQKI